MKDTNSGKHKIQELVYDDKETRCKVLRSIAFFGANGAGKSNIIKALNYIKSCLEKNDIEHTQKYSFFNNENIIDIEICFLVNKLMYQYKLKLQGAQVFCEQLSFKKKNQSENYQPIFERSLSDQFILYIDKKDLENNIKSVALSRESGLSLRYIAKNQNIISQYEAFNAIKHIQNAYNFFTSDLWIIFPTSSPRPEDFLFTMMNHTSDNKNPHDHFEEFCKDLLTNFDTGICEVSLKELTPKKCLEEIFHNNISHQKRIEHDFFRQKNKIGKNAFSNRQGGVIKNDKGIFLVTYNGDNFIYSSIVTHHKTPNGKKELYYWEASDGTKRLLDLSMAFWKKTRPKVVLIDELENSLHPKLVTTLVQDFTYDKDLLNNQLILATHEAQLFNQEFLRIDGIYIVEKSPLSETHIARLNHIDPNLRFDRNLKKSYELGLFGGVPNIT